ncbi:NUMOD4 motif-containing HNH endonuclease [Paramicrobacterium chengjingii]|uniref:NUMOD4 motif-containing HNH endonuclease n=1 Tax=Paramicrobacterium chengjingii TaxID=2769067 RepID=UPI0014213C15|nr:NUMOD4 motif-containing HNH endonuclease [Microbacterium chengjingii]
MTLHVKFDQDGAPIGIDWNAVEVWRPVVGNEDAYEVSSLGRIRRSKNSHGIPAGKILTPNKQPSGHLRVTLRGDNHRRDYIHRVVARAFLGEPSGPLVRHLDGDPENNRVSNLAYGSTSDNLYDAIRHGSYRNGGMVKTHCKRGHQFDKKNTYVDPSGYRVCRACQRMRERIAQQHTTDWWERFVSEYLVKGEPDVI